MTFNQFITFTNQYGLPWALLIAVSVAYWLEVQDRKKNSIPVEMYLTQQERCNTLLDNDAKIVSSLDKLTELLRIALTQRGDAK